MRTRANQKEKKKKKCKRHMIEHNKRDTVQERDFKKESKRDREKEGMHTIQ
jgi:hypothetical protein